MIFIVALLTLVFSQYSSVQSLRLYFRPSDGCSLPCQLGLKVEETTGLETKHLLASHPWVLANQSSPGYSYAPDEYAQVLMTTWDWQWSGQQPDWLVDRLSIHLGWKSTGTDAIRDLRIHTTLTIGDTWLILGLPEAGTILPYLVPTGTKWDSVCADAL